MASNYLQEARTLFKGILEIEDELILVDARNEKSEGFEVLKNVLKKLREEIIVSKFVNFLHCEGVSCT